VADNGIGIPTEQRQRVFRIFQRLHGREIPGTGIGLAICRKVIERHQGVIEITDSPYGGAAFSFTLPDSTKVDT
jgi:signal transduction histidine kinase